MKIYSCRHSVGNFKYWAPQAQPPQNLVPEQPVGQAGVAGGRHEQGGAKTAVARGANGSSGVQMPSYYVSATL